MAAGVSKGFTTDGDGGGDMARADSGLAPICDAVSLGFATEGDGGGEVARTTDGNLASVLGVHSGDIVTGDMLAGGSKGFTTDGDGGGEVARSGGGLASVFGVHGGVSFGLATDADGGWDTTAWSGFGDGLLCTAGSPVESTQRGDAVLAIDSGLTCIDQSPSGVSGIVAVIGETGGTAGYSDGSVPFGVDTGESQLCTGVSITTTKHRDMLLGHPELFFIS